MESATSDGTCNCNFVLALLISTVALGCFTISLCIVVVYLLYSRNGSANAQHTAHMTNDVNPRYSRQASGSPRRLDRQGTLKPARHNKYQSEHDEYQSGTPRNKGKNGYSPKSNAKSSPARVEKGRNTDDGADGKTAQHRISAWDSLLGVKSRHTKNSPREASPREASPREASPREASPRFKKSVTSPAMGVSYAMDVSSEELSDDSGKKRFRWKPKRFSPQRRKQEKGHKQKSQNKQQPRQQREKADAGSDDIDKAAAAVKDVNPVGPIIFSQLNMPKNVPRLSDSDKAVKNDSPSPRLVPQKIMLLGGPFNPGQTESREGSGQKEK